MLDFLGRGNRTCDGVTRRSFLRVGGLAAGGLALPDLLRYRAAAEAAGRPAKKTSVICIWQGGGPSNMDMYDLKPDAPVEFRGEFKPISTNVPGIQISEHLPHQAKIMDKLAVVRSCTHPNPGHGMASHYMLTGWLPRIEVNNNLNPACGAVVSNMRGSNAEGMPPYVVLPRDNGFLKAAYIGASYNPFSPEDSPNNSSFNARNLKLPVRIDAARLGRRKELLASLDTVRRDIDSTGTIAGLDKFYGDAMDMVTSDRALKAFDVNQEDSKLRDHYGRNDVGQCALLARRLVEAGVTYVTIAAGGGWDTHGDNFNQLKKNLLPPFDRAVAALVTDLYNRGMQNDVLVMAFGEFGRTPRINPTAGRDHWPGTACILFSGGGLKMGQMIGATDSHCEYPTARPCSPGDVLSTMYHVLGIDHHHLFYDEARRPLAILPDGEPVKELVG